MARSRVPKDKAKHLLQQAQALQLRAHGHNYRSIAKTLDVSLSTAHTLVGSASAAEREGISQAKADLVELEVTRCDMYLQALAKQVQQGSPRAIDTALKIAERRSRLLGLDAPTRQEVEIKDPECLIIKRRSDG